VHANHEKGQMSDATSVSAALVLLGVGVCAAGLTAVLFGRAKPLPLRSRRQGLAALCAGAMLMIAGTAITTAADPSETSMTDQVTIGTRAAGPTAPAQATTSPTTATTAATTATTVAAAVAVDRLVVRGRGPKTGYDRELFGQSWFDADRNGCDTRNDILRRDLVARAMKNDCKVLAGTLLDPYTASTIRFVYGGASEVDIDHVVAVSDAWQKGAARWTAGKRLAFANDPLNLLAVDAHTNRSKGDGDTATWLPPNKAFRCSYVARQVAVKLKYQVSVTTAEKSAMQRVLGGCPTLALPSRGTAPTVAALPRSSRTSAPATTRATSRATKPASDADVRAGVHPGSFCAPAGALGRTTSGTLMRCRTSATDTRNRWRRA
jgi:hypothetical protein